MGERGKGKRAMGRIIGIGLVVGLTLGLAAAGRAANGMNMISYGPRKPAWAGP